MIARLRAARALHEAAWLVAVGAAIAGMAWAGMGR